MKNKIISAVLLLLAISAFVACNKKEPENKETTTAVIPATAGTTQAPLAGTTDITKAAEELITDISTTVTQAITETATQIQETTTQAQSVATTAAGRIYTTESVENGDYRYGVVVHLYKTTRYQIINGERVDIDSYYSDSSINRSYYSATYDELLPYARQNRETYRSYIDEVLSIINGYRAEEGIAPLTLSEDLTVMSCVRAEEIAWSGNHSHRRPGYRSFTTLFREAGFETGIVGENLGWGYSTPQAVCQAWRDSETHFENIMNPEFTEIGIGVAADPDPEGKLCWTQHFHGG